METGTITTLVENTTARSDLQAEHGLAFWIDTGRHRVLFDTGQGDIVLANARALDVPLEEADAIVLSHGHYDHTGGLAGVLLLARRAQVFLHPGGLSAKYARDADGRCRSIGMPQACRVALSRHPVRSVPTEGITEVVEGVFATGAVPRANDFEDTGGPFFLDEACTQPDPLVDDQSLFFESTQGLVVLLGMIKFGSRTDVIIPEQPGLEVLAQVGQKMRAGMDILARIVQPQMQDDRVGFPCGRRRDESNLLPTTR